MRALVTAAAVILSVTAVHAQEMKSVAPVAQETADRAIPPAAATPTPTLIEQLKTAGELKDPKTLEAPAPRIDAAEAKPAEAKSVEAKPVEAKPVEAKPADAQPVVAKPVEAKPVETKPVEAAKPVETKVGETKAVESKSAQAAEAKPARKRVVRKRETDEQKARRIAAKYGVTW